MRTGSYQAEFRPAVVIHHGSGGCKCLGFALSRAESLHLLRFPGLVTTLHRLCRGGVVTCPCARLSTTILVQPRGSGRLYCPVGRESFFFPPIGGRSFVSTGLVHETPHPDVVD